MTKGVNGCKMVHDILHFIPQGVLVSILFVIAFLWTQDNGKQCTKKIIVFIHEKKWIALFLFYAAYLFTCTIFARGHTYPFRDILGEMGWNKRNGKLNDAGLQNILIFIPYIYLFVNAFKPPKCFYKCILLTIGTTAFIEIFQLLFWVGEFSFADLLQNIIGGILGFAFWCIYTGIRRVVKKQQRWKSTQCQK